MRTIEEREAENAVIGIGLAGSSRLESASAYMGIGLCEYFQVHTAYWLDLRARAVHCFLFSYLWFASLL